MGGEKLSRRVPPPSASLTEISSRLEETARLLREHLAGAKQPRSPSDAARLRQATRVRAIIATRALRRKYLGFCVNDASWAMLLELYAAWLDGQSLSQTRLGVEAGIPQTTTLRMTRRLTAAGLLDCRCHEEDKRLLLIALTDEAAERMAAYISAADEAARLLA